MDGLNLLPRAHLSSVSAAEGPSGVEKPEPLRLNDGASGSGIFARCLLDLQSLTSSETLGGGGMRSPGGPSNRRREESRVSCWLGGGPSRRQLPENLESSSKLEPEKPDLSFAMLC